MKGRASLGVLAALGVALSFVPPLRAAEPEIAFLRLVDEGSLRISGARATRGAGASATVVVVLENARGDRLVLRRAPAAGGGVQFTASLGGPDGVSFTRQGDVTLFEAGSASLSLVEADLQRPTVRCWLSALVSRVNPKLLEAAANLRTIRDAAGGSRLADVFTAIALLGQIADPSTARPRGAVRFEKGPFSGEEFTRLEKAARDEIGRR